MVKGRYSVQYVDSGGIKTKTTTTTTSPTALAHFFNVLTLSIPNLNPNKPNYKSAIVSSVFLENLKITNIFLDRMLNLNLRKMVLVFISDPIPAHHKVVMGRTFLLPVPAY